MPRHERNRQSTPFRRAFVAIPARLASTRLPSKPLADMGGETMIRRVAVRAGELAAGLVREGLALGARVVVATDDVEVRREAVAGGADCYLTDSSLPSGTDRIHAALRSLAADAQARGEEEEAPRAGDLVLNVQGDEPFFSVDDVMALAQDMASGEARGAPMGTLAFPRRSFGMFLRSNVVKVVVGTGGDALLFSRAPIPWPRSLLGASGLDWLAGAVENVGALSGGGGAFGGNLAGAHSGDEVEFLHHMGVYAFRYEALTAFAERLAPSPLELREGLEQLRALEAGWRIRVVLAEEEPFGIDTPEDLERARAFLRDGARTGQGSKA